VGDFDPATGGGFSSGHPGVDASYYSDADYQSIIDYAFKRMRDKNRDPYSLRKNNCKTFGQDAIKAGRQ
jgi:hypothetical protein